MRTLLILLCFLGAARAPWKSLFFTPDEGAGQSCLWPKRNLFFSVIGRFATLFPAPALGGGKAFSYQSADSAAPACQTTHCGDTYDN